MSRAVKRALAFGPALFFLSGCCCFVPEEAETTVIVVPSRHDGHVGAVVVTHGNQQRLLNTAYAQARSPATGRVRQAEMKPRQVEEFRKTFAAASEALPPKVMTYTLYFEFGSEDLTAESSRTLETILSEVATREAAEILLVGHSDAPGTPEANLALSVRRAEAMRDLVVARGVPAGIVTATGVGDADPEVSSDVEEARNRRVEITVR
jgi:outer membrane protein OmpA-like peptidoglycan-associated protein